MPPPYCMLLTAGSNAKGQLGIGSYDDAHTFTPCRFAGCAPNQLPERTASVVHIACGANHTVLLLRYHSDEGDEDGGATTLWGAGDGQRGQLGLGYASDFARGGEPDGDGGAGAGAGAGAAPGLGPGPWPVFCALDALPRPEGRSCPRWRGHEYKHVAAAWETTYVVLAGRRGSDAESDVLLAMGSNDFGALGVGDGADTGAPQVVGFDHLFSRATTRGTVCVLAVHAGPRHVVAELRVTVSDARDVGTGGPVPAPRHETVLVGWGASRHGQLGPRVAGQRCVTRPTRLPIDINDDPMVSCALGNQHTVVLHASGRVSAFGSNKQGQTSPAAFRARICRLGCTWNGTYVQVDEGDGRGLFSMGGNAQGQLGRGWDVESASGAVDLPADRALSDFACGSEHVLAAMSSPVQEGNSVVGWGWNEHGNMGLGSPGDIPVPTQLWPRKDMEAYNEYPQRVIGIWAGCATSWLFVE